MREMNAQDWQKWLSESEILEIQKAIKNPNLISALEKVLCHEIYNNGVLKPGEPADYTRNFLLAYISSRGNELSDEKLGAEVRSYWWGLHALQTGFNELKKFEVEEINGESENPAI